jgi:hypothetical protein
MTTSPVVAPRRYPGRIFLALGLLLTALGVVGYIVQVSLQRLTAPWYLPGLATLGVVCLVVSLWQARTIWRGLALLLVVLVAAGAWMLLVSSRVPPYTGPIAAGKPFPPFATSRADGRAFTERDLEGEQENVLVSFRGRW